MKSIRYKNNHASHKEKPLVDELLESFFTEKEVTTLPGRFKDPKVDQLLLSTSIDSIIDEQIGFDNNEDSYLTNLIKHDLRSITWNVRNL